MVRPLKERCIAAEPTVTVYKPAGVPARALEWVRLRLDEYEALRLVDGEGLDQEAAAERMGISRPTLTRILGSARRRLAQTLIAGAALVIEGGPVVCGQPGRGGPGHGRGWRGGGQGGTRVCPKCGLAQPGGWGRRWSGRDCPRCGAEMDSAQEGA